MGDNTEKRVENPQVAANKKAETERVLKAAQEREKDLFVDKFMKYIDKAENTGSDGKYTKENPYTRVALGKGNIPIERGAVGKYQISEKDWEPEIAKFAKEKGYKYTGMDSFKNNPILQEEYMKHHVRNILLDKYYPQITNDFGDAGMTKEQLLAGVHYAGYGNMSNVLYNKNFNSKIHGLTLNDYFKRGGIAHFDPNKKPDTHTPIPFMFQNGGTISANSEAFKAWYARYSSATGNSPNPYEKEHYYDYESFFNDNITNPSTLYPINTNNWHLPSKYKLKGHPRTYEYEDGNFGAEYREGAKDTRNSTFQNGGRIKLLIQQDISSQGYKDNSPYKNAPNLLIESPTGKITMDNVSKPLMVESNTGQRTLLQPNSGVHQLEGTKFKETPVLQNGGDVENPLNSENTYIGDNIGQVVIKPEYLPTISEESYKKGTKCNTTNCSEYTTTEYANILGLNRDKVAPTVSGDAWYKKDKVLQNKGKIVWEATTDDKHIPISDKSFNWANADVRIGDFVGLGNGKRRAEQGKLGTKSKDGFAQDNYSRHSGIIIGKTSEGVPIVRHNYLGKVYDEPINDIKARSKYNPVNIFRSNLSDDNYKTLIQRTKEDNIVYNELTNYKDSDFNLNNTISDLEGNSFEINQRKIDKKIITPYKNIRRDLVTRYKLPAEELDKVFTNLLGISAQESSLDNSFKKSSKSFYGKVAQDILPNWANKAVKATKVPVEAVGNTIDEQYNKDYVTNNTIPNWAREKEIALLVSQGKSEEEAKGEVYSKLGVIRTTSDITEKSRGAYRQKAPSERWKKTGGEEFSTVEAMKNKNWNKEWDDNAENLTANAIGLYLDNLKKAKETYPDEADSFYEKIAILAHNAPTQAFNKEYTDFYVKGIGNPDTSKYNSEYVQKVLQYKKSLLDKSTPSTKDNTLTEEKKRDTPLIPIVIGAAGAQNKGRNTLISQMPSISTLQNGGRIKLSLN